VFNSILAPIVGFLGPWIQYRTFLAAAKTDNERKNIKSYFRKLLTLMLGFAVLLIALIVFGQKFVKVYPALFAGALVVLVAAYVGAAARMGKWANRMFRDLREERVKLGEIEPPLLWEYRSRLELFGLPLVHIRFNRSAAHRGPVKAWIAAGDFAFGVLFAFGGLAVAPFSIGGIAIGLMPWGGVALGLFAVGGFALGGWVFGGFALGWQALGGCAVAWHAAMGGLAIARDFALGGTANAAQANSEIASQFMKSSPFFTQMEILSRYIGWLNLLWLIPVFGWYRLLKKNPK
jgi:hypothetical protein